MLINFVHELLHEFPTNLRLRKNLKFGWKQSQNKKLATAVRKYTKADIKVL